MTTLENLRSYRLGPFAIFDFASAYGAVYFLAPKLNINRKQALWLTLPAAIIIHKLTNQETPLNKMVLGPESNTLAQLILAGMLYQGLII